MARIYLAPSLLEAGARGEAMELDAESARKLTRVLRLGAGEVFVAFDGLGGEWDCALIDADAAGSDLGDEEGNARKSARRSVAAAVLGPREAAVAGRLKISVAQALPKGDKMEFVLQKGTELGVAEFWPFAAGRSVPILDEDERMAARAERWRKIARQAAAQCGRADVPVVHAIGELATAIDYGTANSRCFMLDEAQGVESLRQALAHEGLGGEDGAEVNVMVLVGPEGGWTEREREWADRYGVERVGLGRLVLRTETAALAAVAILQWVSGDLG